MQAATGEIKNQLFCVGNPSQVQAAKDWARRLKGAVIQAAGWLEAGDIAMGVGRASFLLTNGSILGVDGRLP